MTSRAYALFENSSYLYIFFLNTEYIAARSLRSLRSNNKPHTSAFARKRIKLEILHLGSPNVNVESDCIISFEGASTEQTF